MILQVPYFMVKSPGAKPSPTLLYGYGGFRISLEASYLSTVGAGWCAHMQQRIFSQIVIFLFGFILSLFFLQPCSLSSFLIAKLSHANYLPISLLTLQPSLTFRNVLPPEKARAWGHLRAGQHPWRGGVWPVVARRGSAGQTPQSLRRHGSGEL